MDEDILVNDWVAGIDKSCRLERVTSAEAVRSSVDTGRDQVAVRKVELVDPADILWCAGSSAGNVTVVWADGKSRILPLEENLLASERKRLRPVVSNGRATAITCDIEMDAVLVLRDRGNGRVGNTAACNFVVCSIIRRKSVEKN